jgi:hypothetical protein
MVEIGIAHYNWGTVTVDQDIDTRSWIKLPDSRYQWQRADKITDVVPPNDENFALM